MPGKVSFQSTVVHYAYPRKSTHVSWPLMFLETRKDMAVVYENFSSIEHATSSVHVIISLRGSQPHGIEQIGLFSLPQT
jgi:hypothetical protein